MGSALVIVGLALVLAVQIAILLRIAKLFTRVATLVAEGSPSRSDADEQVQLAAAEERARLAEEQRAATAHLAEEQRAAAAEVLSKLNALERTMATTSAKLKAREAAIGKIIASAVPAADVLALAEAMTRLAEQLRAWQPKVASVPEEPDERKTIEMAPPVTGAPPPAPGSSTAPPAGPAPSGEGADDEGWDDPEEKTKLFSKDAATSAVLVAKGAPAARHALRPPPPKIEDEGDDAMERPSILPEARR